VRSGQNHLCKEQAAVAHAHVARERIAEQKHQIEAHRDERRHPGHDQMDEMRIDDEEIGEDDRDRRAENEHDPFGCRDPENRRTLSRATIFPR
jgi:hypothetical protein